MFLVGILQWWYGNGWVRHAKHSYIGVLRTADFFSIGLLLKTLFNPFKQISAHSGGNSFAEQLSAFADRLFSRCVGGVIRFFTIIIALVAIVFRTIFMILSIVLWTALPLAPLAGLVLWVSGVAL